MKRTSDDPGRTKWKKRPGGEQPDEQPSHALQHDEDARWAADFRAELERGAGEYNSPMDHTQPVMRQQPSCSSGDEHANHEVPPTSAKDEEARQGLIKVVASMERRVDEGNLQVLRMQCLQQQKEDLLARGESVLDEHCGASWHTQQVGRPCSSRLNCQQSGQMGQQDRRVKVESLQAECAGGQWSLRAVVTIPAQLQHHVSSGGAALVAASPVASLVCRQQQCNLLGSGNEEARSRANNVAPEAAAVQVQLTSTLDVLQQQQQQQQMPPGEDLWADVFLVIEQAAGQGQAASICGAEVLSGPAVAAPPTHLGRVQLRRADWVRSHSKNPLQPAEGHDEQHSLVLAVEAEKLDLSCLQRILQDHLGFVPAQPQTGSGPSGSQVTFMLKGAHSPSNATAMTAGSVPAAEVAATASITQHSKQFAELQLQADSRHLLGVLQQQVCEGVRQAVQQGGLPPGDADVKRSLLAPQHAQQQAAAADVLVRELDASIEWVEALLKQKLALDSQQRRNKLPLPSLEHVYQKQIAAVAAMAATDGHLVSLLGSSQL